MRSNNFGMLDRNANVHYKGDTFVNYILDSIRKRSHRSVSEDQPAEAIGKNKKVLRLVIGNLTTPYDRRNIEKVSKTLYSLCNEEGSYIPLTTFENNKTNIHCGQHGGFHFMVSRNEISLFIFRNLTPGEVDYRLLRRILWKYGRHMDTLCIMFTCPGYYGVLKDLSCFKKVRTIEIDIPSLQRNGIGIFKYCRDLRPTNLRIRQLSHYQIERNDKEVFTIPSSVQNIHFASGPECLKWLLDKMRPLPKKCFENFTIIEYSFSRLQSVDDKFCFLNIIQYFKQINYYIDDIISNVVDKSVTEILYKYKIASSINLYFSEDKFNGITSMSPRGLAEFTYNRGSVLSDFSKRFLSQPGIYLNIHMLKISDKNYCRKHYPFSSFEVKSLTMDVEKMKKLEKLDIDLHLFGTFTDFKYFCNGTGGDLKYLRVGRCSTIMSYYFSEISSSFKKLEYLFLNDVGPYTNVSFREILEYFPYLKGLKVVFNEFYNPRHVVYNLEKKVNGKKIGVFEWPKIDYLYIVFNCSITEYYDDILKIERNTPRKMGQFLIKRGNHRGKIYCHIVFQRCANLFDRFEQLFDSSY
uniref:F-box domain-containing protein n=1 Tax=Strongyloides papillosus TaxID=174720 RepID=A0A0N5BHU3_STREA